MSRYVKSCNVNGKMYKIYKIKTKNSEAKLRQGVKLY